MTFPKELITVTTVSRSLAMFLFIAVPFVGFLVGLKYQQQFTEYVESRASVDQYLLKTQPSATPSASTASPAPNGDRTDWKTFRSKRAPFLFKYPPDWPLVVASDQDLNNFSDRYLEALQFDRTFYWNASDVPLGYIYVEQATETRNIQEYVQKVNSDYDRLPTEIKNKAPKSQISYTEVAGIDTVIVTDKASTISFDLASIRYVLFKDNLQYILVLQHTSEKETFDQILSTFKFIP